MITILKASAGSGKTYKLTETYIRLLLSDATGTAYRRILAVTFTNKATDEMKRRILKELYGLSSAPAASPYAAAFVPDPCPTLSVLQEKARLVLSNILHDYGAFAVSTIDRFFQQTLKAFSRELGLFSSYKVELDRPSLVEESVARVLDAVSEQEPSLLEWLSAMAMEQIEEGGRYNLMVRLSGKADRLLSEERRVCLEANGIDPEVYTRESLRALRRLFRQVMEEEEDRIRKAARGVADAFEACGVGMDETSRGSMYKAVTPFLEKAPGAPMPTLTDAFVRNVQDYASWWRKGDLPRMAPLEGTLMPPVQALLAGYAKGARAYNTARLLLRQIGDLGLASELRRAFDALVREKNVVCLEDANHHLKEIIDGSDAPFVYEKMGVRYDHFLLDEFQDTARIQWENFRPLIANSEAQGFANLLVGDVKQSIYRWRGSDWKLMAEEVGRAFPVHHVENLRGNWRSLRNIVHFNNAFFPWAATELDRLYGTETPAGIGRIYDAGRTDAEGEPLASQKVMSPFAEDGYVSFSFTGADRQDGLLLETVRTALSAGARPGEIAILVRNNRLAARAAGVLLSDGIEVVSDDALSLSSSAMVRQLVSLLSCVSNPDDAVGSYLARQAGFDAAAVRFRSLPDLCEQLIRLLGSRFGQEALDREARYLFAFLDAVQDFVSLNGNAPEAFLRYWKEKGAGLSVSAPSDADAVRVMTIHKAKGLEFPYVVFPYAEKLDLFREENHWSVLRTEGTPFAKMSSGAFDVMLSAASDQTFFAPHYREELRMQYVDNLNLLYVTLTRPVGALSVIATAAAGGRNAAGLLRTCLERGDIAEGFVRADVRAEGDVPPTVIFRKGTLPDFAAMRRETDGPLRLETGFPSWPLVPAAEGEEDVRTRGRLKFSVDALAFFSEDASLRPRRNGIILHDILSSVRRPSDLPDAVEAAYRTGVLDRDQADSALRLLSERIAAHPEWFPETGARIVTEASLIDSDGQEFRPDRVILRDGGVTVLDYKFGAERPAYARQVARYADIYRRMGYAHVETVIWYVPSDRVVR